MTNLYGLFFSRDNIVLRLPVNPEKLPVERDSENEDYNVLGIGPIMIARLPKQRVVTIQSYFPGKITPWVLTSSGFELPEFYISFFESAMRDKVPIIYTPVRYYPDGEPYAQQDIGFPVLVTQFNTEEKAGEEGDFYFDLTLTEYKDYSPLAMQIQGQGENTPAKAYTSTVRAIPEDILHVGMTVYASGDYYADSAGNEFLGISTNQLSRIARISEVSVAKYPILITRDNNEIIGWFKKSSIRGAVLE